MKLRIVAIYDHKTQVYMGPSYVQHTGQALRSFQELVNDGQSMVSKYPEDFGLYELGEFDDTTGQFDILQKAHSLASAISVKKQPAGPMPVDSRLSSPSLTQAHA